MVVLDDVEEVLVPLLPDVLSELLELSEPGEVPELLLESVLPEFVFDPVVSKLSVPVLLDPVPGVKVPVESGIVPVPPPPLVSPALEVAGPPLPPVPGSGFSFSPSSLLSSSWSFPGVPPAPPPGP